MTTTAAPRTASHTTAEPFTVAFYGLPGTGAVAFWREGRHTRVSVDSETGWFWEVMPTRYQRDPGSLSVWQQAAGLAGSLLSGTTGRLAADPRFQPGNRPAGAAPVAEPIPANALRIEWPGRRVAGWRRADGTAFIAVDDTVWPLAGLAPRSMAELEAAYAALAGSLLSGTPGRLAADPRFQPQNRPAGAAPVAEPIPANALRIEWPSRQVAGWRRADGAAFIAVDGTVWPLEGFEPHELAAGADAYALFAVKSLLWAYAQQQNAAA